MARVILAGLRMQWFVIKPVLLTPWTNVLNGLLTKWIDEVNPEDFTMGYNYIVQVYLD